MAFQKYCILAKRVKVYYESMLNKISNLVQKREIDTIWNERSRVINISWDNLFRNRP